MNIGPRLKHIYSSLLLLLMLALLYSSCAAVDGTTTQRQPTLSPTQPGSSQSLLASPITYVALGASDAVGVGSKQPGSQGYVPLIAERLPKGSRLINLGISGIHLHDALEQEVPLALSTKPQLITLWLVANDFIAGVPHDSYMRDLNTLLKRLQEGTKAKVVMANLPDLTQLPAFRNLTADQKARMLREILRWNASMQTIATRYQVDIVDLLADRSQLTTHPQYVSVDGFHPSPEGYVHLANLFWKEITT